LGVTDLPSGVYVRVGKRVLDVAMAIVLLGVAFPVLAVAAALVAATSRGPVLFRQARLGRYGQTFDVLKFRTMTDVARTSHVERFGSAPGITPVGALLRRTKVDELPQLLNVLRGDMSLVGPRPALPGQLLDYDDHARRRLLVRPGMTGLAQVHGNIHLSWPERWNWDVQYVDRLSLALDVWILARTAIVVLLGEDRFARQPPRAPGRAA
jgi:lipopolysaccharide/colanic/teichoic acid biosynthesis glycosyltransferase